MRRSPLSLFLLILAGLAPISCNTTKQTTSAALDSETSTSAQIFYESYYNLNDYTGETYLQFMRTTVKPEMDRLATEGYRMASADDIESAYELVDRKVQRKVDRSWGGLSNVKRIAGQMAGETVTMHTLPGKIRSIQSNIDQYGLSTFLGLASGGGVKIKYYDGNYALNVHYDRTEERSGRSFGVGPTRMANDASDKQYLDDLQAYGKDENENLPEFYRALMQALLNSDSSNYKNVAPEGQTVLTDFLAVFTAEQARNLMDGYVSPHWDAALLEVTLLAAFHAGQRDGIKLFYFDPQTRRVTFTNRTRRQTPCRVPETSQEAHLRDYWQFSRNINSESNCGRSGINITKDEFRKLGEKITGYVYKNHREIFDRVKASLDISGAEYNLFKALSYYLINNQTPASFAPEKVTEITEAWVQFLETIQEEAPQITAAIEQES